MFADGEFSVQKPHQCGLIFCTVPCLVFYVSFIKKAHEVQHVQYGNHTRWNRVWTRTYSISPANSLLLVIQRWQFWKIASPYFANSPLTKVSVFMCNGGLLRSSFTSLICHSHSWLSIPNSRSTSSFFQFCHLWYQFYLHRQWWLNNFNLSVHHSLTSPFCRKGAGTALRS